MRKAFYLIMAAGMVRVHVGFVAKMLMVDRSSVAIPDFTQTYIISSWHVTVS